MADLTTDTPRTFGGGIEPVFEDHPVAASTAIYQGNGVGQASATSVAKNLNDTDAAFLGFAERRADNSAGAAADIDVTVRSKGIIKLSVSGVTTTTAPGTLVYAHDGDTFDLTSTSGISIGRVHRVLAAGSALVAFEASSLRSADTSEV